MRIGIDLMGGDNPPQHLFEAVLQAALHFGSKCTFIVIATKSAVQQLYPYSLSKRAKSSPSNITFKIVADTIAMAEDPIGAVRRKKDSSLVVGMRLLKKRQIDGFVSCGNTGALITSAALSMPMLPRIIRPALLASMPTEKGMLAVLDVGGNVSCKAQHLVQFAILGAAYQRAILGIETPRVGLLNVGVESKKGTQEIRQTYEILKALSHSQKDKTGLRMDFIGNIEGRDIFNGGIDVLVTDGFAGNVMLKTVEGAASIIFDSLAGACQENAPPAFVQRLDQLHKLFNYHEYPGAIVCGTDGVIIKVHGNASSKTLYNSIIGAAQIIKNDVISQIKEQLLIYSG